MDDMYTNGRMPRSNYLSMEGIIVEIEPLRRGGYRTYGCMQFITVEMSDGNIANFIVSPSTFVVDYMTLYEGMNATFYYDGNAAVPLIYPPQYNAVVVAPKIQGQNVYVGYFNNNLINSDGTLQLNMNEDVTVVTTNNQTYFGNIGAHNLVVIYDVTTRSIPAQTIPIKVIVMCNSSEPR